MKKINNKEAKRMMMKELCNIRERNEEINRSHIYIYKTKGFDI